MTSSSIFILTIHEITKNDLLKLDNLTHRCIKQWTGLPRCATNSIVQLQTTLSIPSITHIFNELRVLTYPDAKIKGDFMVNDVLHQKLERERDIKRKSSIVVEAAGALQEVAAENPSLFVEERKKGRYGFNYQPLLYCICRGEDEGNLMLGCVCCEEWYHPTCLNLTDERVREIGNEQWKCPLCEERKQSDFLLVPQPPALSLQIQNNEKHRVKIKASIKSKLKGLLMGNLIKSKTWFNKANYWRYLQKKKEI